MSFVIYLLLGLFGASISGAAIGVFLAARNGDRILAGALKSPSPGAFISDQQPCWPDTRQASGNALGLRTAQAARLNSRKHTLARWLAFHHAVK